MNKIHNTRLFRHIYVSAALILPAASLFLSGCNYVPWSNERFLEVNTPEERLRNLQTLDMQKYVVPENQDSSEPVVADSDRKEAEEISLSLEECRKRALENNLDIKVALFSPTIAEIGVTEEEARYEAVFSASGDFTSSNRQTSSTLTSSKAEISNARLGVTVPLRTGGTINIDMPFTKADRDLAFNTLNPSFETELNFSLTQQLLRGAGLRAGTHGIRIAEYQRQESEARTKLEVIGVLAEVDRQYWLLYAARRELEVRQKQYELAMAQYKKAQRMVKAEEVPQVELLRAESGVADRLQDIIAADNNVKKRQRSLKRLLNSKDLPMKGGTEIITVTDPTPVPLDINPEEMVSAALDNRMEMLELELQLASDMSTLDFEKNQALPMLALDYSYGLNAVDDSFGDDLGTISEAKFDTWRIGLRGEIPLGNRAAKARVYRAILTRLQRLATREQRESTIKQEVLDALDNLRSSWQQVLAARQRVVVAARTAQAEQRQFELGMRTSTDVLDAQARLADAQSSEIASLTAYQISQTDLAYAAGMIIGKDRVRWEPRDTE